MVSDGAPVGDVAGSRCVVAELAAELLGGVAHMTGVLPLSPFKWGRFSRMRHFLHLALMDLVLVEAE